MKNPFKLEKLKIIAYKSRARLDSDRLGEFSAMFNPESFKQAYSIEYAKGAGLNSSGQEVDYSRSKPSELNLELLVDGTGVHQVGAAQVTKLPVGGPVAQAKSFLRLDSVRDLVRDFLDKAYRVNGTIHEPNYLVVSWGKLLFSCRLGSVEINYTNFDRDGVPLRAVLSATFLSDKTVKKRMAEDNFNSPDLTHRRIVKGGDTLPLMTKAIYGQSEHYLFVARFNGLDDFRNLQPGREILFPPLEQQ